MWLAAVRDVAIVLLALESVVIGVLLALVLLQIRKLIRLLREEIAPMLDSANHTLHTVQGTTTFVSKNVVSPIIRVSSATAGTAQALRSLFSIGRRVSRKGATPDTGDQPSQE